MVKVDITTGYGSCEECGRYEWGEMVISRDGNQIGRRYWDGHLGGSIAGPEHDLAEFIKAILSVLDIEADVNETFHE